ncbi:MAG: tripartite tricarboxylate transporter substrate binding protein [Desulfobacterales bacterium]|jgi:tripartite-type tricarboxylate transporter receptor subunit TctC|nr:tripartite tricarboxylate transporter substrate binding protein [Desulfobacterales bacterium]
MKKVLIIISIFALVLSFSVVAVQAEYPDKPINYIISFNPGGESDITARLQEKPLEDLLKVPVNVTHKPGGGGAVAWSDFQRTAKPDGYTLVGVNIPHIIGQPLQRKDAGYSTDGFNIIMWFHFTPNALIVNKDSQFKTLKDFIDFAKKNPQVITVGGSGTYSANHLETLRLEKAAGIKLTYIPHTGTGPLVPAVLGGHLTCLMNYSMLGVQLKDQVRVLAIASEERVPFLPDAPTFKEQGYDIVGGAFRGIAAPLGTPKAIVDKLANAFTEVNKKITEKQEPLGFVMTYATGDKAQELTAQMKKAYGDVFQDISKEKK